MSGRIRVIAVAVIRNGDRILLEHGFDSMMQQPFYRPPGGGVEFGEEADEALRREMREELSAEISEPRLLGVLENIFTYEGSPHHEVAFVFETRIVDTELNGRAELQIEIDAPGQDRATWFSPAEVAALGEMLCPKGLQELLRAS